MKPILDFLLLSSFAVKFAEVEELRFTTTGHDLGTGIFSLSIVKTI